MSVPWCGVIDPAAPDAPKHDAEFRVYTHRKNGGPVGPSVCFVGIDVCEEHVGVLLAVTATDNIQWTVTQL